MYPWLKPKPVRTPPPSAWSISIRGIKPSCTNCAHRKRLTHFCTRRKEYVVDGEGYPKYPKGCEYWEQHKTELTPPDGKEILKRRRKHRGATTGSYRCQTCGALIGLRAGGEFKCPYCGGRILEKVRQKTVRTIKAV